jgi:hypothetical protein
MLLGIALSKPSLTIRLWVTCEEIKMNPKRAGNGPGIAGPTPENQMTKVVVKIFWEIEWNSQMKNITEILWHPPYNFSTIF